MSERKINIDQSQASIGTGYAENITAEQIGGTIHNYAAEQNLTEAAAEIHQLLEQLAQTYPTETLSQQEVVVQEVKRQINNNPTLKERIVNVIKAMGVEALKEAIDHPLANVLVAGVQEWKELK
jgi:predicted Mrr-cat superfamily restriction endonuclease